MIVTVMSDASFCHHTKAAGWGVWVKSQRGLFEGGGNFKQEAKNSMDAEAMAISIAVWVAFRQGIAEDKDIILVQTDCEGLVRYFTEHWNSNLKLEGKTKVIREALKFTVDMIKARECEFRIRHVKGHAKKLGGRNYVNHLCDRHARKAMEEQREKLREQFPIAFDPARAAPRKKRKWWKR